MQKAPSYEPYDGQGLLSDVDSIRNRLLKRIRTEQCYWDSVYPVSVQDPKACAKIWAETRSMLSEAKSGLSFHLGNNVSSSQQHCLRELTFCMYLGQP